MMQVRLCLPVGGRISQGFLDSIIKLVRFAEHTKDYKFHISKWGNSDLYVTRNCCLRYPCPPEPVKLSEVKPWGGTDYDKILWIDSDTVFTVDQVKRILSHDADIVTGLVKVDQVNFAVQIIQPSPYGGTDFAMIRESAKNPETGEVVNTLKSWVEETKQENGLCPITMCGAAFLAVKRGVYEKIGYPWYRTELPVRDGMAVETSEDLIFCHRARAAGFEIWADPEVRPGHEKATILW